jgi:quinohemoprotein ethanol dehydrogenase
VRRAVAAQALAPGAPDLHGRAFLRAWDPRSQRTVWQVPTIGWWDHAGVLATAGGLVFQGSADGHLRAFDAANGRRLKDIDTGTSIIAAPMSYAVDGVQYVAVMAGAGGGLWHLPHPQNASYRYGNAGRILVFRLDGAPTPKPAPLPPPEPVPAPPAQTASPATVARGQALFEADCSVCHANLPGAASPDLTRMGAGEHAAFDDIVLGGLLKDQGMPQWSDVLSRDDAHAIHAYLIDQAARPFRAQQNGAPRPRTPVLRSAG